MSGPSGGRVLALLGICLVLNGRFADSATGEPHWSYTGPHGQEHWKETYPICGGDNQSPVDVRTDATRLVPDLPPVSVLGYDAPSQTTYNMTNNGHTLFVKLPPGMEMSGGGLPWRYEAVQFHLHWGSVGRQRGSEHYVDGVQYAAEIHIVHFNKEKYKSMDEAMKKVDGLAVLGVLVEVGPRDNEVFTVLMKELGKVKYSGQQTVVQAFSLLSLLPKELGHFFRYNGSLTTPGCDETVTWTLLHKPIEVSVAQLTTLTTGLTSTEASAPVASTLENNFRFPQPLGQRKILTSFPLPSQRPKGLRVGDILAIIFGILFVICFVVLVIYCFSQRRKTSRQSATKRDVIYKPAANHDGVQI
ncbi:carbonic anhydrase 14-like [Lampetra fluviatilis]